MSASGERESKREIHTLNEHKKMFAEGISHFYGIGRPKNISKAEQCFVREAKRGNTQVQFFLGLYKFCNSKRVEAKLWFDKAVKGGHILARYYTACCSSSDEAVLHFRFAARQGHARSQRELGLHYFNGIGIGRDVAEAVRLFYISAEKGDISAKYYLGICYLKGYGVLENRTTGLKWLRKAAESGHVLAQLELAECYLYAYGLFQNSCEAGKWRRRADQASCFKIAEKDQRAAEDCFKVILADLRAQNLFKSLADLCMEHSKNIAFICFILAFLLKLDMWYRLDQCSDMINSLLDAIYYRCVLNHLESINFIAQIEAEIWEKIKLRLEPEFAHIISIARIQYQILYLNQVKEVIPKFDNRVLACLGSYSTVDDEESQNLGLRLAMIRHNIPAYKHQLQNLEKQLARSNCIKDSYDLNKKIHKTKILLAICHHNKDEAKDAINYLCDIEFSFLTAKDIDDIRPILEQNKNNFAAFMKHRRSIFDFFKVEDPNTFRLRMLLVRCNEKKQLLKARSLIR